MSEKEKTADEIDLIISVGSDFAFKEAVRVNTASAQLLQDAEIIRDRLIVIEESLPQDLSVSENPSA